MGLLTSMDHVGMGQCPRGRSGREILYTFMYIYIYIYIKYIICSDSAELQLCGSSTSRGFSHSVLRVDVRTPSLLTCSVGAQATYHGVPFNLHFKNRRVLHQSHDS